MDSERVRGNIYSFKCFYRSTQRGTDDAADVVSHVPWRKKNGSNKSRVTLTDSHHAAAVSEGFHRSPVREIFR